MSQFINITLKSRNITFGNKFGDSFWNNQTMHVLNNDVSTKSHTYISTHFENYQLTKLELSDEFSLMSSYVNTTSPS